MVLSITICTYNRIEYLKKCLKSILDQTQGSEIIEINIIDNHFHIRPRTVLVLVRIGTITCPHPHILISVKPERNTHYITY